MFRRLPLRAYPSLVRYTLRRRLAALRPPPAPELSDSELDFFWGGADSVEQRLAHPTFQFFLPAEFGPPPTLDQCQSILAHRFSLLGGVFDAGNPIQWRRDFRTGHEWPRDHISKLELTTQSGDVKMPWELSRFHHGLALALGYAHTGDERYPREWAAQVRAWREDNPPEHGPNWGNAMEAAIRAANWIAAFQLMRPAFDRAFGEWFLKALIQHGRFITAHLEEYWPPTNHILSNCCGLIWLGLFCSNDLSRYRKRKTEADHWLALGLRELQRQIHFQVLPDDTSYEASVAYHRFVTEMVSATIGLCELNGVFVLPSTRKLVAKMEAVIEGLRKPDGTLPLFGDEDGGRWLDPHPLPLSRRERGRGEGGWESFPHGGWFAFRDGDEYLAVRAGGNGQAGWGGHAHNDALSFEYSIGTRNFLIDPGTFAYTVDPQARNLFRSTAYHNTLRVDGQEISRIPPGELFRLEDDVQVKVDVPGERGAQFSSGDWEGEHGGYQRLGVIHRRLFERWAEGWIIEDEVVGEGEHELKWFFHFAPECELKAEGSKASTQFPAGPNIRLEVINNQSPITVVEGWISPTYGRREKAAIVVCSMRATLPVTVTFIITKL